MIGLHLSPAQAIVDGVQLRERNFALTGPWKAARFPDPPGKRFYLCHRGVDPGIVALIAYHFRRLGGAVTVQRGDGMDIPITEFLRRAAAALGAGTDHLIVLLSEQFPGDRYHRTFGPVEADPAFDDPYSFVIRVDDCESSSKLWLDLAAAKTTRARRRALSQAHWEPWRPAWVLPFRRGAATPPARAAAR